VQHYFGLHWRYMDSNGYAPETHIVWSDGCAAQFKSSKPWYFVSCYPNMVARCFGIFLAQGMARARTMGLGLL
jgi:hypothetical protein